MFARNMPTDSGADTANYIGIEPDYRSHMKEKFTIDTVNSNEQAVTFICKSKFDIKHIMIPNRVFTPECQWAIRGNYLGTECNASKNINATTYPTCDGTLTACRKRGNTPRYGGFLSIPKLR
jgi:phage-related protein